MYNHYAGEVRQALTLLMQWAPMDVEDALELLSPNFTHPTVRRFVQILKEFNSSIIIFIILLIDMQSPD